LWRAPVPAEEEPRLLQRVHRAAEALARAIETLVTDEPLRKKLGQSAHQTIIDKFTPEKELEANLDIYRELGIPS
jgi:glycosyltransferase involved in cell wall biosynthesis